VSRRFDKVFVGSNHKMYKTNQQTMDYIAQLLDLTRKISRNELCLFILPPYTVLAEACRAVDHNQLWIGAQNMHWEAQGPYTGEISPLMLQEIGVDLVMLGHAERRQHFGEEDWMVNRRLLSSLAFGFHALVCVGDTAQEYQAGISAQVVDQQLQKDLFGLTFDQLGRIWVAYEPVWSIGEHGTVADPETANAMHTVIRESLGSLFPGKGETIPILYGGSVNRDNAVQLIQQPEIDGLFIGRAAWDAEQFYQIIQEVLAVK
jgi:triosephosphate isomerase